MRSLFIFIVLFLISVSGTGQTSIYSYSIDSISGNRSIDFSLFKGKKILIVNMSSGDSTFNQYEEIKQLYYIYKDSLVIVVSPTNSFNKEPGSNLQIASLYKQASTSKFYVAAKLVVKDVNIHPLYLWLTSKAMNGIADTQIKRAGYKFLINKEGRLIGIFNPMIMPMSNILRQAIELNN